MKTLLKSIFKNVLREMLVAFLEYVIEHLEQQSTFIGKYAAIKILKEIDVDTFLNQK